MALPKVHRIRHRKDFSTIYRAGLRHSTVHLTLRALHAQVPSSPGQHSGNGDPAQLGISISQKVSKKAVVRNRIRRQLQAAFQQLLPQIPGGWQLVIVVRPEAVQCDYGQFLQELKQLLVDAEVIDGH